jgi:hypothetical protein
MLKNLIHLLNDGKLIWIGRMTTLTTAFWWETLNKFVICLKYLLGSQSTCFFLLSQTSCK